MSNLPPSEIPRGAIRFNTDSNKPELWDGSQWAEFQLSTPNLGRSVDTQPGARGLFAGGYSPSPIAFSNTIDYVNISSTGNGIDFGDLSARIVAGGGVASRTRGVFAGGYVTGSPFGRAQIDFVTIASTGDAADFGDLNNADSVRRAAVGNATRGLFGGGGNNTQQIDYITITSTGNANDYGDLSVGRSRFSAAGSAVRGVFAGGFAPGSPANNYYNTIDFVSIATLGDAQDFGDLTSGKTWTASASNSTRMLIGGGDAAPGGSGSAVADIDYITIATGGNATSFGNLNKVVDTGAYAGAGLASPTRGVFNTGLQKNPTGTYINTIYYVQIATQGQAQDFGDLQEPNYGCKPCSNAHGGL